MADIQTARHECGHWLAAECLGYKPAGILFDGNDGYTGRIAYPLTPATYAAAYAKAPADAEKHLMGMVLTMSAGAFAQQNGGVCGGRPQGSDLDDIQRWAAAVQRADKGAMAHWHALYAEATRGLTVWYRHSVTQRAISTMATAIQHMRGLIACHTLHDILAQHGLLQMILAPHFEPIVAAECYMPGMPPARRPGAGNPATGAPRTPASVVSSGGPQRGCCATLHSWNHDPTCQYAGRPSHQYASTRASKPTIYCVRDDADRIGYCDAHNDDVDDCPEVEE
jgi:hypothetical protein